MVQEFSSYLPVRIIFGNGRLGILGESVRNLGSKTFLMVDPYLETVGLDEKVIALLKKSSIDTVVYANVCPDPTYTLVEEAAQIGREEKCDAVIAIGGGSTIDAAKGVAILATNPGRCGEYIERFDQPTRRPAARPLPIIAVPTTAGTGSEVAPSAVLTDPKTGEKGSIESELIFPKVALVDPELMISMPPKLTAFTGTDALSHAIESYINVNSHPYLELLALEAIRLVVRSLPAAVANGNNREARSAMAWASTLAGISNAHVGTVLGHALGQTIGGFCHAPHGKTLAACLPQVMNFCLISNLGKFSRITEIMDASCNHLSLRQRAEKSVDLVQRLLRDCDAETTFTDCGLEEKEIDRVTDITLRLYPKNLNSNPRQVTRKDVQKLYRECLG